MSHSASQHSSTEGTHAHTATQAGVTYTEDGRVLNDPTHEFAPGHGNTPGSWAMAIIIVLGVVVGSAGLLMDTMVVTWVGVALIVLGALVGVLGARSGDTQRRHH
ncbi:MAG: HGxxPAAW family protein [Micrococcus sp.]|nr:HGxxPAAW family protein [Micrococcus sp.]